MKTKHTPGPYVATGPHIDPDNGLATFAILQPGADAFDPMECVALLPATQGNDPEAEANAALFAAAPCTLAALEAMQTAYGRLHDFIFNAIEGGRMKEADIPDDYSAIIEQLAGPCQKADHDAKAAIAKARGEG